MHLGFVDTFCPGIKRHTKIVSLHLLRHTNERSSLLRKYFCRRSPSCESFSLRLLSHGSDSLCHHPPLTPRVDGVVFPLQKRSLQSFFRGILRLKVDDIFNIFQMNFCRDRIRGDFAPSVESA